MNNPGLGFSAAAGLPLILAGWIYFVGAWRRIGVGRPVAMVRHAAFGFGLAVLLGSVERPFEAWTHELYSTHQIGILITRTVAPMAIAVSQPAGLLVGGLPTRLRQSLLKPALSAPEVQRAWRWISHPVSALAAYVGALYFWEIPAVQATSLDWSIVGYAMDLTLLLAGLLFWTRVFERRPAPHGPAHPSRLAMISLAVVSQILLGACITFKETVLYPAYHGAPSLGLLPLFDEQKGGLFIWIPTGLLALVALLAIIDGWGHYEARQDDKRRRWTPSNSAILLYPTTGRALREMASVKNRSMAVGIAGFVLLVFGMAVGTVVVAHRVNRRENIRLYLLSRS